MHDHTNNKHTITRSLFQEKPWYQTNKNSLLTKVLSITARIFQHFPSPWREQAVKWIDNTGLFIIRILRLIAINQPYHAIEGQVNKQKNLSILYRGDLSSLTFLLKKLFPDNNSYTIKTLPQKKNIIQEYKKHADIQIIAKDYFFKGYYQRKGYIVIPENISFILPTKQPFEQIIQECSNHIQKDINKAKTKGYSCTVSNDIKDFSMFYHTMYLPYITWKYKGMEKFVSYEAIKHFSLRGSNLLLVQLHNITLFGGIFDIENQKITTQYAGVKEGYFDHIKQGIISLSYYYLIALAKKKHITSIDFGTSPPFLNDGLCRYKLKWNMRIKQTNPTFSTIFAIHIKESSKHIMNFFKENPFFYYKKNTLSAAIFLNENNQKSKKEHVLLQHNYLKRIDLTFYHSLNELKT